MALSMTERHPSPRDVIAAHLSNKQPPTGQALRRADRIIESLVTQGYGIVPAALGAEAFRIAVAHDAIEMSLDEALAVWAFLGGSHVPDLEPAEYGARSDAWMVICQRAQKIIADLPARADGEGARSDEA
jgi:hypothetical protein